MRPRSASAPRVCSRPNQRALSSESASTLDKDSEQLALLVAVGVGRDVFDRDHADERAPGAQRGVEAAAAERREAVFAGLADPVGDHDRSRRRHRAADRLRQVPLGEAGRNAHALGELGPPAGARVVGHEHDERGVGEEGAHPLANRLDDLAEVERRRQGLRERVQRDEEVVGGRHLRGLVDRGGALRLDLDDEVARERAERAAEQIDDGDLARPSRARIRGGIGRLHRDRRERRDRAGDARCRRSPGGPTRSRRAAAR